MKTKIKINDKEVEIELTPEQVKAIQKHSLDITERIKTFEDVLEYHNTNMDDFLSNCKGLTIDEIAYKKIKLIVSCLNEGWTPDWNNTNQYKYYPYFDMRSSGFSNSHYATWTSHANGGSPLVLKSEKLSNYTGTQFNSIYKEYLA